MFLLSWCSHSLLPNLVALLFVEWIKLYKGVKQIVQANEQKKLMFIVMNNEPTLIYFILAIFITMSSFCSLLIITNKEFWLFWPTFLFAMNNSEQITYLNFGMKTLILKIKISQSFSLSLWFYNIIHKKLSIWFSQCNLFAKRNKILIN